MAIPKLEQKNLTWIEVSNLLLDDQNFRLSEGLQLNQQKEILGILDRDFELLQIGKSFVDNGYFVEEPMIVIPGPSGKHIVVEGNRRLAALKLLLEKDLRLLSKDSEDWENLAKSLKWDLTRVPVVEYDGRDKLRATLGYRHISGILKWDPLSKARFINNLVERMGKKADFLHIARETGSRKATIRDNYIAYRIFLQAESLDIDTSNLTKDFGVFLRALSSADINKFIGLDKDKTPLQLRKPISKNKAKALEELIGYTHGTEKFPAVLIDSRNLTMLGMILNVPQALDNLRIGRDLRQAYALTGGEERRLVENLKRASFFLDEALRDAHRHTQSREVKEFVKRCTKTLNEILKHFPKVEE